MPARNRHRNRVVPVFRKVGGQFDELYRTTSEKAKSLVSRKLATVCDPSRGVLAGIVVTPSVRRSCSPNSAAAIETHGMYTAVVANGLQPQESPGELVAFVRSRSPYRWAEMPRITPKRRK